MPYFLHFLFIFCSLKEPLRGPSNFGNSIYFLQTSPSSINILSQVVTFEFEPSVLYYRDSSGKVEFPFGIDIEVVNALSRTLNFTIIFEEPPKGKISLI